MQGYNVRAQWLCCFCCCFIRARLLTVIFPKNLPLMLRFPSFIFLCIYRAFRHLDSERLLIKPMEKAVARIEGIKELSSTGYLGGANVVMEFDAGFDVDKALQEVRNEVDKVRLPADADDPTVSEVNVSLFPVMQISLSGNVDEKLLLEHAKDLSDRIEILPEVLSADIEGERAEVVELIINPEKLQSYNLTPNQIIQAVNSANLLVPAGNLQGDSGQFAVKVPGLIEDIRDLQGFPIISSGESVVTLKDVTDIKRKLKDITVYSRLNGKPGFYDCCSQAHGGEYY